MKQSDTPIHLKGTNEVYLLHFPQNATESEMPLHDKIISQLLPESKRLEELTKAADQLAINLKYVWERSIEARGACHISSMERGEIEKALENYNALKSKVK